MTSASDSTPSSVLGTWAWIATCVLLALSLVRPARTPQVQPASAGSDAFSAERALAMLARILGDQAPHPAGTQAHRAVRERILAEARALGLEPAVQSSLARGPGGRIALVHNIVARLGPATGPAVLLAAHYDSVGAAPGASDDGAGCAVVLEIARALRDTTLDSPVILLFSDGEELGLIGAQAFADEHPWSADVGVVINLEARGTSGPSLMFETSGPSAPLIERFARAAVRPFASSLSDLIYKYMPNDTDLSVFRARGVPGYNFAFIGGLARYHTPLDDLAHLDARSVQHHGDQALALVRELTRAPLDVSRGGESLYFDVLGWRVAWRERSRVAWLTALLTASSAWCLARALRAGRARVSELAWAAVGVALAFSGSMVLSWLMVRALAAWHGVPDPGAVHPAPLRLVCAGAIVLCTCWASAFSVRRGARFASAWYAGLATTVLGACATQFVLWRAGHLAFVPALAWCSVEVLLKPTERGIPARICALALVSAIQALLWLPLAQATELGFGFRLAPMVAAPMALGCIALWPAWLELARRARVACLAAMACVVGALVSAGRPAADEHAPTWLNLRFVQDSDTGTARFEASTFESAMPPALATRAAFAPARTPPFPWLSLDPSMHVAPAPTWDVPPPLLEVLEARATPLGRRVRARLSSPRGAVRLHLHLDERTRLRAVQCAGRVLSDGFEGVRTQLFFAVPSEGLEVELEVEGSAPARAHLLDQDWTLPDSLGALLEARPASAVPRSDGDVSLLGRSFEL